MKYEKPTMVHSADALLAVRSSDPQKGLSGADHSSASQESISAYQADE
jgi:hypothetical protein